MLMSILYYGCEASSHGKDHDSTPSSVHILHLHHKYFPNFNRLNIVDWMLYYYLFVNSCLKITNTTFTLTVQIRDLDIDGVNTGITMT